MMKKLLVIIRNCIVVMAIYLTAVCILQQTTSNVQADSGEPTFSSATTIYLTKDENTINISDFLSKTDVIERLSSVATLDDVDLERDCSKMSGMEEAFVTGFDVKSEEATNDQKTAMLYNTWLLQQLIYCADLNTSGSTRATIVLPEGTFYFMSGHKYMANGSDRLERHVIKPHNNIVLKGVGTEIDSKKTVLKPYSEKSEFNTIDDRSGAAQRINGGLDMFFFNDLSAFGTPNYLIDVHFSNFVIDSAETAGVVYNTGGKGFMINLFQDNTWYNVTVQNTDGTGFGVDCPRGDSWIDHSRAYGNGKGVWVGEGETNAGVWRGGGSGFGIGTGYADDEKFEIRNSIAKGNGIFGYFYENQNRFNPAIYTAASSKGFTIKNSTAEANTWNYGGLRSYDTVISNVKSNVGSYTQSNGNTISTYRHIHFSDESRNIKISDVEINQTAYQDNKNGEWYTDAILWAETYGIAGDKIKINEPNQNRSDSYALSRNFGVKQDASRADIVAMIWHMMGYEGTMLSTKNGNLTDKSLPISKSCFIDVDQNRSFAEPIKWASEHRPFITNGIKGDCASSATPTAHFFDGSYGSYNESVTRAEAMTMIYRLAGSPSLSEDVEDFVDVTDKDSWYYNAVKWAVANKITTGVGDNKFEPNHHCTREQIVTFLYRYWAQFICTKNCPDADKLLDINHNK